MIPAAPTPLQQGEPQRWQALWRDAVRDPRQLLAMLGLNALADGLSEAAARQFPLRVPPAAAMGSSRNTTAAPC